MQDVAWVDVRLTAFHLSPPAFADDGEASGSAEG